MPSGGQSSINLHTGVQVGCHRKVLQMAYLNTEGGYSFSLSSACLCLCCGVASFPGDRVLPSQFYSSVKTIITLVMLD